MEIKRLEISDVPAFFELYKTIVWSDFPDWNEESKNDWIKKDYSEEFWKKAISHDDLPIFVAEDEGKFVGYVAIESVDFGVAYLGWIGVLNETRGKGVARKLMEALIEQCKQMKIHKIELETQLPELLPFFIKTGFELEGVRRNSWQNLDNYMFGMSL